MLSLVPSLHDGDARSSLEKLLYRQIAADLLNPFVRKLHKRFLIYASTCPVPLPSPGLIITQEIRRQSELYLPVADIATAFNHVYRAALKYSPIIESSPFHKALSWADVFVSLPQRFQSSANPARLLEELINRPELLVDFLFESFLPRRFYGGFRRYPQQRGFVDLWLRGRTKKNLRCLDAACGTGEASYDLAVLLLENGFQAPDFCIEGWTLEALEVWAAAHARFPHDMERETAWRGEIEAVFKRNVAERILFRTADLRDSMCGGEGVVFDLILCNGLLGGPILHKLQEVKSAVTGLARLLAPGGILLVADRFHCGWKQKHPQDWLRVQFESLGLDSGTAGEGLCASRPVTASIDGGPYAQR